MNVTDQFINQLLRIADCQLSPEVYLQARACLLDYLGVTMAGACAFQQKAEAYLQALGEGGNAQVIGGLQMASAQSAALVNGLNAHVIELDDGHRHGAVHVGATIFSALLAVAEKEHLTCANILYGAIIGYETTIRLACAIQPGNKLRGYHATGTCGTLGAAMAVAAATGQNFDQMKSTLSAAVASSAGVLEMQEDDSDMKPLNVGRAAMDAVACAYLGKAGFKAPADALGGRRGFLRVMTDEPHPEYLTDFDGNPLAITQIYQKPYAACRHAHSSIEAALTIRPSIINQLSSINSILVEAYKLAISGHDHTDIQGISSAKMSIPFGVALALVNGSAGLSDFTDESVTNSQILDLTKKVSVVENEELTSLVPLKRASIVTMKMVDGTSISYRVDYPKGEPENPLTEEELQQKFASLAMYAGLPQETCEHVMHTILYEDFDIAEVLKEISEKLTVN